MDFSIYFNPRFLFKEFQNILKDIYLKTLLKTL